MSFSPAHRRAQTQYGCRVCAHNKSVTAHAHERATLRDTSLTPSASSANARSVHSGGSGSADAPSLSLACAARGAPLSETDPDNDPDIARTRTTPRTLQRRVRVGCARMQVHARG